MRRREFIAIFSMAAAGWPFSLAAQEAGRTYRIGGLSPSPRNAPQMNALFEALRRFGFIEGQNLTVDWRAYAGRIDLLSEFAADLTKAKVDVIFAGGNAAIRAAQQATATIPILAFTDDMLGSGLVSSLARPGGNTTGVSLLATELDGKRQDILVEAVPGLRRIAALADYQHKHRDSFSRCNMRRAREASSFRFIRSPSATRSYPRLMRQRHQVLRHSTSWRRRSCSPIVK